MSLDASRDVVDYISTNVSGLTKGTNIFASSMKPPGGGIPVNCVFVRDNEGPEPVRNMGQASDMKYPNVSIILRWKGNQAGRTKVFAIMDALRGATISGYQDVKIIQSAPTPLGLDEDGNEMWQLGYSLTYEDAA